jgi:hypothetical protein
VAFEISTNNSKRVAQKKLNFFRKKPALLYIHGCPLYIKQKLRHKIFFTIHPIITDDLFKRYLLDPHFSTYEGNNGFECY